MVEKLFAIAAIAVALAACGPRDAALSRLASGEMAAFEFLGTPELATDESFLDADGREVRISDFAGQVVLVNLWATWCAPCVHEMPQLDALQAELGGEDFVLITVSADRRPRAEVEAFLRDDIGAAHLPLYMDNNLGYSLGSAVGVWPTTILYDREGYELGRMTGPAEWNGDDARALIEGVIEATRPAS